MSEHHQTIAAAAAEWFETRKRDSGEEYTTLRDGRPEWLQGLVRAAHDDLLPDDWRYECTRAALAAIEEADSTTDPADIASEFAELAVDTYTSDRLAWLSSGADRPNYVDRAVSDYGPIDGGIVNMIGAGQHAEATDVFWLVWHELENIDVPAVS